MYSITRIITIFLLVLVELAATSCSDSAAPASETDRVRKLLTNGGKWTLVRLTVGGVDQTSSNAGFTIVFGTNTYITNDGEPVWAANGTWSFTDSTAKEFAREDGLVVSILSITDKTLDLGLSWSKTTFESGRLSSIPGTYHYKLER